MTKVTLTKQFNISLFAIAGLTLLTISIASHTVQKLNNAYQRAASDFIPLMQSTNKLQSTAANLKSALFKINAKTENSVPPHSIENITSLWQQTQVITEKISRSHLLDGAHHIQLQKENLRINEYIIHTQHLSLLLIQRSEIKIQLNALTPKILTLLRKTETQLLSELTQLSEQLHRSITLKEGSPQQQVLFMQIRHYFQFYKQALLMAEKMVEAQGSHNVATLNKLKRNVYQLGNRLEHSAANTAEKNAQKVALDWLQQAFSIYKGKHSIFNTQLKSIRTEYVIKTLINQQVETAEKLLQDAKNIHLHIQNILEDEAQREQQHALVKQYILWALSLGAISLSVLIAWIFIHKKIVARVLRIRQIMMLLARGRTQINIQKNNNDDEFGDMEKALIKLQGYVIQVQTQATTDTLTQLNNRRAFDTILKKELSRSQRNQQMITLFIIDIDHFKQYNDYYGHPEGDVALQDIAKLLVASCLRENDFIARVGGEEFAVILPNIDKESAQVIASRIQENTRKLNRAHIRSSVADYLTLSIGGKTIIDSENVSTADIYRMADNALYKAKIKRNDVLID